MDNIVFIAVTAAIILVAVFTVGMVFARLYRRATPEMAFVRTGMGGSKVITSGGALIVPILHECKPVNMQTLRLSIERRSKESLITKDKYRADAVATFFVRVETNEEAIQTAARTFGDKLMEAQQVQFQVESKLDGALRAVASEMTLADLQEKRGDFVQAVQKAVAEDLNKNGLGLESVSLTYLNQTSKDAYDPNNVFDAEGLTRITQQVQSQAQSRNEIEQTTKVAIAQRNYQATQEQLAISQREQEATINQQREVAFMTAEQRALVAQKNALADKAAKTAEIERDAAIKAAEIARDANVRMVEQDREIKLAQKSEENSAAQAKANAARAEAVKSEQDIITVGQVAEAERRAQIVVIGARQDAETEAVKVTVAAAAKKEAAENEASALMVSAKAEADAQEIRAKGVLAIKTAEANGEKLVNEAANALSSAQLDLRQKLALIAALPRLVAESVRPIEKIDGIKVVHVGGMGGAMGGLGGADGGSAGVGAADQVVNAALRHRAMSPLIDGLLKEIGVAGGVGELFSGNAAALVAPAAKPAELPSPAPRNGSVASVHS